MAAPASLKSTMDGVRLRYRNQWESGFTIHNDGDQDQSDSKQDGGKETCNHTKDRRRDFLDPGQPAVVEIVDV